MIIRLSDRLPQPWKNGLGRTRQIAVHPVGAGTDDFVWRVSIAEVDSAAPFSSFPGIDRQIALLDGNGFTMTFDDDRVHSLTTPFTPLAFAGEAKVAVSLVDGPTRDFNLMVRRAQAQGELQVWRTAGGHSLDPAVALVYCAQGVIATADGHLYAGDVWRPGGRQVTLFESAVALVVRITASA